MVTKYSVVGLTPGLMAGGRMRAGIFVDGDDNVLLFTKDAGFTEWLHSEVETADNTVGELNRAMLHRLLDAWLDGVEFE